MHNPNLINGQKPQWGNPAHIRTLKQRDEQLAGKINFHTIDWALCKYTGKTNDQSKLKYFYCGETSANAVVDHIKCPRCSRIHVLLVPFDATSNWYDQLLRIDESVKEFSCWNCELKFEVDEIRDVRVKQEQIG